MQRSLDGFTLIELVGFGPSGEVWRARPDDGGPDVALKWLLDNTVDTALLSSAPLRDFEHPHVARLVEVRRDASNVVLVEEFISGGSLARLLIERTCLSSGEMVTLLTPVAEALGAAHAAGLLHGNLSPGSILFTPDGRPVVTDLGVWQALEHSRRPAARLEYLDPSVARGGPLNEASDVFSVAAIGFHALTGRPPWSAGSGAATWQLAADGEGVDVGPLQAGLPPRLAEVISRGLSDQPRLRGSAREFAADVRDAIEPEPLQMVGPYLWPNLPDTPDSPDPAQDVALSDLASPDTAPIDIAGAVRRAGSSRHAAAPSMRRTPTRQQTPAGAGGQHGSKLRSAAQVVPRQAVVGALVVLAILGVVVLGLGWNSSKAVPAQSGGSVGATPTDVSGDDSATEADGSANDIDERALPDSPEAWTALLSMLYERRAAAFGTGATPLLGQVFTADSPQLVLDSAELALLIAAGHLLRGFAPRVLEILEMEADEDRATLRITDEFGDYETVPAADPRGAPLASHPGRGPTRVAMDLVLTEDGWRIHTAQRLG